MWVQVLLALMVEGYREFMKWWQTRAFPPAVRADDVSGGARVAAEQGASDVDRTGLVAETVGWILDRHARKSGEGPRPRLHPVVRRRACRRLRSTIRTDARYTEVIG
jgi:hypothetical protein